MAVAPMSPESWSIDRRGFSKLALVAPAAAVAADRVGSARARTARSIAPLVIPAVNGRGAHLATVGHPHRRLELKGVNVWGITDFVTASFAPAQYADRAAICAAIAAWGGNHIRLRVLADEWVHLRHIPSKAAYLTWIRNWVAAAKAHGLYVYLSWWDSRDSSDNTTNGVHWAERYAFAFPMMAAVHHALRLPSGHDDPAVFYEPFNEPAGITWDQWLVAMKATVRLWRSTGYQGVLVFDTIDFSHGYSEHYLSALEEFDAGLTRSRRHNLMFARHDYCTDYPGFRFSPARWHLASGGAATRHVLLESEFGNFNLNETNLTWSRDIARYFRNHGFGRTNIAGMSAFLFGNWYDANAMSTDPAGRHLTPWGKAVRNFLA